MSSINEKQGWGRICVEIVGSFVVDFEMWLGEERQIKMCRQKWKCLYLLAVMKEQQGQFATNEYCS